ncbi:MMPL family transporter [Thermostilla marina]
MSRRHEFWLSPPLEAIVWAATRVPGLTVALAAALAVLSIAAAYRFLDFHTSRADLLSPHSEYHQRWLRCTQEFGAEEDVYVVVEGPDADAITAGLDAVAQRLRQHEDLFCMVLEKVDASALERKGLYYLDQAGLLALVRQVESAVPPDGDWNARFDLGGALVRAASSLAQPAQYGSPSDSGNRLAELEALADRLNAVLAENAPASRVESIQVDAISEAPLPSLPERFLSNDGKLGLLMLRFRPDDRKSFSRFEPAITQLNAILKEVRESDPSLTIGATGLPILEYDEMQASNTAQTAAVVALFGVAIVFYAGFAGWRHPTLIAISLVTAVVWTLGFTTVSVGHLNILTSAFGAMLIGLGDYGVHYVAHYLAIRPQTRSVDEALLETARSVGPGIAVGAFTTAGAFLAAAFTDFLGIAELGIIAGIGILLCWAADMTMLPAMLKLIDRRRKNPVGDPLIDLGSWFAPLTAVPRLTVVVGGVATILLMIGIPLIRYDYNLLRLQPEGTSSVAWQEKLIEKMNTSAYFALSMAEDANHARTLESRFAALSSVSRVESLADAIPSDAAAKQPLMVRLADRLRTLPENPPAPPVADRRQVLQAVRFLIAAANAGATSDSQIGRLVAKLQRLEANIGRVNDAQYRAVIDAHQRRMALTTWAALKELRKHVSTEPPRLEDLPESLVRRFVSPRGKHLVRVYCAGDFWNHEVMEQFVQQLRSVDPEVTGNPLQIYEASHQMNQSYLDAAGYALVAILVILLIDFRRVQDVLLAMLPLVVGGIALFGLMGHLGIPFNPANMIVLPLILGIGIDNGVHIVHDYRRCRETYSGPSVSTLTAVMVNSLTTMVGFGALMLASHRGLQSLGRVLTLGIATCLTASLLLPALLVWYRLRRDRPTGGAQAGTAEDDLLTGLPLPDVHSHREAA